jgi:hypothetical protein
MILVYNLKTELQIYSTTLWLMIDVVTLYSMNCIHG